MKGTDSSKGERSRYQLGKRHLGSQQDPGARLGMRETASGMIWLMGT